MPAALTVIWCRPNRFGGLAFAWQGPPGRTPVDGYRVERTRDGRDYEPVAEIRRQDFVLAPPAFSPNSEVELARRAGSAAFRLQERRKARGVPVALFLAGLLRRERRAPCAHAAGRGLAASEFGFNAPWFYRLSAFNARGQGPAKWVFFYLRRRRDPMFLRVPVRPGLRVVINEFLPA